VGVFVSSRCSRKYSRAIDTDSSMSARTISRFEVKCAMMPPFE